MSDNLHPAEIAKLAAEAEMLKLKRDVLQREHDMNSGMPLEKGVFDFYGEITPTGVYNSTRALSVWSHRFPGTPLEVGIDSPGGSVIDGLHLFDFLRTLSGRGHFIKSRAQGMAASMGGILLQAGDHRIMAPNSFLLIHEASSWAGGKLTELQDETAFIARLQEKLVRILAERSSMTERQIKNRMARKDWWLDAEEALELGFVDSVEW